MTTFGVEKASSKLQGRSVEFVLVRAVETLLTGAATRHRKMKVLQTTTIGDR